MTLTYSRIKSLILNPLLFTVSMTLFYGIFFIFSEFYKMPYSGFKDFVILFLQWGVVLFATFGLLHLLSLNKYVYAVTFPVLTSLCSILAYFRFTANVSFTPMAIDLALVNDARTSMEVVTIALVLFFLFSLAVSIFFVWIRFKYIRIGKVWWIHLVLGILVIILFNSFWVLQRPVMQRIPYCIYYSFREYFNNRRIVSQDRPAFKGKVSCDADDITVVFILGETVRESNLGINGYKRQTTPLLCKEKNVVSLPHIYSQYGFTHTSVPYLLTRADSLHPDRAYQERSLISLFREAGYHTSWLANQESVDTYVYFMKEADTLAYVNSGKSVYIYSKWLDEDLLPVYGKELKRNVKRNFILLHTIGSHWWYNGHFTDKYAKWKPVSNSRVISSNTPEQLINSYDNSILYSDYIWNRIINGVRNKNAIVVYLSDHSENLGENGLWGHGQEGNALHHPGCWIWYSDKYARLYPDKVNALKRNKDKYYNSSFLFHTLLSAGGVRTKYIEREYDVFN